MIFHTSKCFTLPYVFTWSSNQVIHCVNLSVTWWPRLLFVCVLRDTPFNGVSLHGIETNSTPWLIFHTSLAIVSPFPLGYLFPEFY
jgi:hypothetical protein